MRRFKTKKYGFKNVNLIIILISIFSFLFLYEYNKNLSYKIIDISKSKLDEATTLLIKKDITPLNANLNELLQINLNKDNEIVYMDINLDKAYELVYEKISKIQNNIKQLESGKLNVSGSIKSHNNNVYTIVNLGLSDNGVLFANLGPKVPVKLEFYEHVLGTVDAEIKEYGINNALVLVYLTITLTSKIVIPYQTEEINKDYEMLIASKVINGTVPTIYGGGLKKSIEVS